MKAGILSLARSCISSISNSVCHSVGAQYRFDEYREELMMILSHVHSVPSPSFTSDLPVSFFLCGTLVDHLSTQSLCTNLFFSSSLKATLPPSPVPNLLPQKPRAWDKEPAALPEGVTDPVLSA